MRATLRLLTARHAAYTPTGITGVLTHPSPRPTLIALYTHTLNVLSQLPPHSVYRQSTEALTRSRLATITAAEAAEKKNTYDLQALGMHFRRLHANAINTAEHEGTKQYARQQLTHWEMIPVPAEIGADIILPSQTMDQASSTATQAAFKSDSPKAGEVVNDSQKLPMVDEQDYNVELEEELSAEQVADVEAKIGMGLVEEVLEQGWAELKCAHEMAKGRVWEELETPPVDGQWVAFERTPATN